MEGVGGEMRLHLALIEGEGCSWACHVDVVLVVVCQYRVGSAGSCSETTLWIVARGRA